ncbi:NUDIX hydrolase [Rhodovulum strictum]|uniref:NUDIX hydrolase n=1 Tax=Rhodovulum strictum TaxID=58314 RepID=A0A844B4A7_9RHOB|nr:NUDIX hydrolase [Rhodovulum strictum]MRH21206.1 NUDIX hydrolase [Rhodovulum strictum]
MTEDTRTATGVQIAALPLRWDDKGALRVLMVTSRGTGRWIMPKGWRMDVKKPWRTAEIEALEEAGALGRVGTAPIGRYRYDKILDNGTALPCVVEVFPMLVERLKRDWKERRQRKRRWFKARAAARRVDEPDLAALLLELADKPRKRPEIRALRKAS